MVQDFGRISEMIILKVCFYDIFAYFLFNRISTKCQEDEFRVCIVYISFSEVIIMTQVFGRIS